MDNEQFSLRVQALRRPTGHSQQELADALGITRQVLARKFSGKNARFNHSEIKQIIRTLAEWDGIITTSEAQELLSLMDLPSTSFSEAEWSAFPLKKLEKDAEPPARWLPPVRSNPEKAPSNNLPVPLTGLIGRERLIQQAIERLLQPAVRLLTLIGPGGIGKTRLSLEIGRRLLGEFNQSVIFIDLSNLTRADQVPGRLAQELGLVVGSGAAVLSELKRYVASHRLLLILDNFEQLLPAAELVSQLMEAAPDLKLLVTSRAVLQIYGESQLGIPPLDLPDLDRLPNDGDLAAFLQFEAVQLFVTRSQAVKPNFQLTQAKIEVIARLCVLLEGLPLSLELAAARVKLLPLPYLYQRLRENKLEILSKGGQNLPARQQTLRATLEWSYSLLDEQARQLFNNLGIFRGSFNLAAVEQICYGDNAPLDLIERLDDLLDQSLLKSQEEAKSEPRFVMLEILREFAIIKLQETGNFEELQERYYLYYSGLIEKWTADLKLDPDDQIGVTALLEQDFDNFQAAHYLAKPLIEVSVEKERELGGQSQTKPNILFQTEHTFIVRRPVDEVFAYISNVSNWPKWNTLIKEGYPQQAGPYRKGMTLKIVSSILGRRMEQTMIISEYVRDEFIEVRTLVGPLNLRHRFSFTEKAGQTRVTFATTNNISQIFRFTRPVISRILERGHEIQYTRLKILLESQ